MQTQDTDDRGTFLGIGRNQICELQKGLRLYIYIYMKWTVVLQQLGEESDAGKYKCGHQHMHVSCVKSKKSIRS